MISIFWLKDVFALRKYNWFHFNFYTMCYLSNEIIIESYLQLGMVWPWKFFFCCCFWRSYAFFRMIVFLVRKKERIFDVFIFIIISFLFDALFQMILFQLNERSSESCRKVTNNKIDTVSLQVNQSLLVFIPNHTIGKVRRFTE